MTITEEIEQAQEVKKLLLERYRLIYENAGFTGIQSDLLAILNYKVFIAGSENIPDWNDLEYVKDKLKK